MLESKFQASFIRELKELFPGCVVLKNDANYIQGFPDLLMLYRDRWAAFECKQSSRASRRPNQDYYVDMLDKMSFARFVSPENKEEVLYDLQQSLQTPRSTRSV